MANQDNRQSKDQHLRLRVFLASPGDVAEERAIAKKIVEGLADRAGLFGKVTTQTIAWDKTKEGIPLLATLTPQQAIVEHLPKLSECDYVVVIFWSRMGTPLPPEWVKPDGGRYLSGTEWECLNALEAARQTGRPEVLIYHRTEEPPVKLTDPDLDKKRDQYAS